MKCEFIPAPDEVWELRYNDTLLNLHETIEHAHLPNKAKLKLAPKEGGGG
jgi:TUG ubiquitin-like domain